MRHVKYNPKSLSYPKDWSEKASDAINAVDEASDDDKSETVNSYQGVWASLKNELSNVFTNKCWYTECRQEGTDSDVDHFRPKNSVWGVTDLNKQKHPGYYWLAFNPENYRFSCIIANRRRKDVATGHVGGKADRFPLEDERLRAWSEAQDYKAERPLLIDPCNEDEVKLIIFSENGEAGTRYNEIENPLKFEMAKQSIDLYHLNHSDFTKARITIRERIEKKVERVKENFNRLLDTEDDKLAYNNYWHFIEELQDMCDETAPHSGFAIAMLQKYKLEDSIIPLLPHLA